MIPDYLKKAFRPEDINNFGEAAFPTISLAGNNMFKIKAGNTERVFQAPLPVIIVGVSPAGNARARSYYEKDFVPGSLDPPDCASSDGVRPDSGTKRQATACNTNACPRAVWGSCPKGRGGQACKEHKIIFCVLANDDFARGTIFAHRVSVTALKGLATYGAQLNALGIPAHGVITMLSYDPTSEYKKLALVRTDSYLPQELFALVDARVKGNEVKALITAPPSLLPEYDQGEAAEPPVQSAQPAQPVYQPPPVQPAPPIQPTYQPPPVQPAPPAQPIYQPPLVQPAQPAQGAAGVPETITVPNFKQPSAVIEVPPSANGSPYTTQPNGTATFNSTLGAALEKWKEGAPAGPAAPVEQPPAQPAPPQGSAPPPQNNVERDIDGLPWDARIHSGAKTKTQDGRWKKKKNVPQELIAQVNAEYRK